MSTRVFQPKRNSMNSVSNMWPKIWHNSEHTLIQKRFHHRATRRRLPTMRASYGAAGRDHRDKHKSTGWESATDPHRLAQTLDPILLKMPAQRASIMWDICLSCRPYGGFNLICNLQPFSFAPSTLGLFDYALKPSVFSLSFELWHLKLKIQYFLLVAHF